MRDLFNPDAPEQALMKFTAAPRDVQFTTKYEPRSFDEVVGQDHIIAAMREFVSAPYSTAFLFHGPTGAGKTSTAKSLAHELGIDFAANFHHVLSGSATAEAVQSIIDGFRLTPWGKAGAFRLVLVDEADQSTPKAKQLWLSALENLPAHTVVVFTTNKPENFDQRTLDRFQNFAFTASDTDAAQTLADRIWSAETGGEDGPDIASLPNVVLNGEVSFRRVAMALQAAVRDGVILARSSAPSHVDIPYVVEVRAELPAPTWDTSGAYRPAASAPVRSKIVYDPVSRTMRRMTA